VTDNFFGFNMMVKLNLQPTLIGQLSF